MNDLARQKLCELIAEQGPGLCSNTRRCKDLLKERCGPDRQKVRLLTDALIEEVPDELLTAPPGVAPADLLARLTRQLQDSLDVSEADARWAVESWALALGVLKTPSEPPPQTAALPTPAPAAPPPTPTPPQAAAAPVPTPAPTAPPAPAPSAASPPPGESGPSDGFYVGREYDLTTGSVGPKVLYDPHDLLTHGVVVGMTGSGKTGLCITLIEEAARRGIPCILIDPKGDLTNLLLQFPELRPQDFLPWINPEDARQKGVKIEEYARHLAERWRRGLEESGLKPEDIARLRDASEFRIYTPGSEAGRPLSVLQTFAAPKGNVGTEALNQKATATTSALLGLAGINGDPVQSREHILIAQLLLRAWKKNQDMDLEQLIAEIQQPRLVTRIGTLDVETFYPEKERLKLAVALNNILASPSFATWLAGEPLDLGAMLAGATKSRQLIFYIAHLDDAQRMFFTTLLLEEVLSWTRKQAGATSLRAILYFDEVFGYLPPHPANPPTKAPLMTLLKQARAFGVGVLLATQNPVDLDYKALSNAGTWFVGKLQTERDKARLLEGLEGVAAERGTLSHRGYLETVISALGNRVFLLHDVHRSRPTLFQSRWALSFLRGPVTPDQFKQLMERVKSQEPAAEPGAASQAAPPTAIPLSCPHCQAALPAANVAFCPTCGTSLSEPASPETQFELEMVPGAAVSTPRAADPAPRAAPVLTGVTQYYIPLSNPVRPAGHELVYQPRLLAFADLVFADRRKGLEFRRSYHFLALPPNEGHPVNWHSPESFAGSLGAGPEPGACWADVPESLNTAKKLKALQKDFADFLYSNMRLPLLFNRMLNLTGEDLQSFQHDCRQRAREELSRALEAEKLKYAPKFQALDAELPADEPARSSGSWLPDLGWAISAVTGTSTPPPSKGSAKNQAKLRALEAEWQGKRKELAEKWKQIGEEHTEIQLAPRKADIDVTHFGLAWVPFWSLTGSGGRTNLLPAYR